MKKIFALLTILSLVGTFAFAQNKQLAEKVETVAAATLPTAGPAMDFETMEVDYGTIAQNSDPYRLFKFTNTGTEPLQITHAKGSCGCTTPDWPKEPIFPGESGEIKVKYDTKRIGKFVKRVTLTTNMPDKTVLTIKGLVEKAAPEPEGVPASQPNILGGGE